MKLMTNNERVVRIGMDILIKADCDTDELAYDIVKELNMRGYGAIDACFEEDVTELYNKVYAEYINNMSNEDYFEAVETCPHCDNENVFPMWDTQKYGFVAICGHCGKQIMLCDECQHTILEDGEVHNCDWCKTKCGGKCHRGETKRKEIKEM